ncbi:1-phosphofructokinase [Alkalibaculum sporogenes]|uniref:1-phosphofructokinase n=1 Tax=Alkalibaculum sporogenes TaxID=2655001 RepID=UPI00128E1702|nr:1-phosphofructokinase [Alkalibaculum sporogenes]
MIITVTLNPALDKTINTNKFIFGQVNKVEKSIQDPGGKGINVSKVLKNIDNINLAIGFIGGNNGEIIVQSLKQMGIEEKFTSIKANTRMNIKIIDGATGETTDLNERGEYIQKNELEEFLSQYKEIVRKGDFVVIAGSVPRGIPDSIYYILSKYAETVGAKVFLDTSGNYLKEALESKVFLIKPNIDELEEVVGKKIHSQDEILDECRKLLDSKDISNICLSMGSRGAMLITKDYVLKAKVPIVAVKSTVGAGDSLLGGIVSYLDKGCSIEEAFKCGVAASVVAVTKEGTKAPNLSEIIKMMNEIQVVKEVL